MPQKTKVTRPLLHYRVQHRISVHRIRILAKGLGLTRSRLLHAAQGLLGGRSGCSPMNLDCKLVLVCRRKFEGGLFEMNSFFYSYFFFFTEFLTRKMQRSVNSNRGKNVWILLVARPAVLLACLIVTAKQGIRYIALNNFI